MEAFDFARAAQYAKGQRSQRFLAHRLAELVQLWHSGGFHDHHRQAAAPLPQAVARVNQRGKAVVHAVPLHIQLYVPAELDIPPPSGQQKQQERPQWRQKHRSSQPRQSRGCRRGADHARGALQNAHRSALAQQDGRAQRRHRQLNEQMGRAREQGDER